MFAACTSDIAIDHFLICKFSRLCEFKLRAMILFPFNYDKRFCFYFFLQFTGKKQIFINTDNTNKQTTLTIRQLNQTERQHLQSNNSYRQTHNTNNRQILHTDNTQTSLSFRKHKRSDITDRKTNLTMRPIF